MELKYDKINKNFKSWKRMMGLCMKLILSYIFQTILIMLLMCIEKETILKLVEKNIVLTYPFKCQVLF